MKSGLNSDTGVGKQVGSYQVEATRVIGKATHAILCPDHRPALGVSVRPPTGARFLRIHRLINAVGAVEPATQVHELTAMAAKRTKWSVLGALCLKRLAAGWTLELRHASSRPAHDDESFFLPGFASFWDVVDARRHGGSHDDCHH